MKPHDEKIVNKGDVSIYTEYFGNPNNPAILLIAGATVSMLYWDDRFCNKLADEKFFVIRYDNRDVGKSTTYSPGSAGYDIMDLVDDAINILNTYSIKKVNVMGISLGGLLAQIIAIRNPERVNSLIVLSSGIWGTPDPTVPEMDSSIIDFQAGAALLDWDDEQAVVTYMLHSAKLMAGRKPVDYLSEEKRIKEEFRRAANYRSMFNHSLLEGGDAYYNRVNEIEAPTLIIHGTDDKIWHFAHTDKLLSEIKNSRLLALEGTGHELNPNDWDVITTTIKGFIN